MRIDLESRNKTQFKNDNIVIQKKGLLKRINSKRLMNISEKIEQQISFIYNLYCLYEREKREVTRLKCLFAEELLKEFDLKLEDWVIVSTSSNKAYEIKKIGISGPADEETEYGLRKWYEEDLYIVANPIDVKDGLKLFFSIKDLEEKKIVKLDKPDIEK